MYDLVRCIPAGRVSSYGILAKHLPGITARMVGYALHACPEDDLPWWRVVNSAGKISLPMDGAGGLQAALLEKEGLEVGPTGKVNSNGFWYPEENA